ncbi:dipeptidase [Pedobacter immunditicola]|uniref:dipeptidase n=1 Tax=Pedobacter immunditicola TaxID=3133440 RepID=UPI0030A04284
MKNLMFLLPLFIALQLSAQKNAKKIHEKALVIDAHNDVLLNQMVSGVDLSKRLTTGYFDLVRAKEGGLDAQIFSIWCGDDYGKGRAFALANRQIDSLYALIDRNPDKIVLVRNSTDLKKVIAQNKMAALIGVEGGHMIEDRVDYVDSLAKRGMCYLTLTWNHSTSWSTSAYDETFKRDSLPYLGLNSLGKQIVKRLNKLGVMVDVSHVGERTFYDVLATTSKPVIASHSSVYAIAAHQRNLKDEQLKAIAKNGGVVFANFYSGFLDPTYKESAQVRPPLSLLIKHIDYMVNLIGADHVGIGADFEGAESFPLGLDGVQDYPKITAALLDLNYSEKDINKIMGENLLRVLKANAGK